ncbi:hypothetical protein [Stutzerimonas stutzeri]|uniref:hypothetical protein n=1 Tax=Stutzerimonas stutzeri TaxID=316 RepID=UPI00190D43B8|nr:hypothetical protein [Stutzerimonas stutzeri]
MAPKIEAGLAASFSFLPKRSQVFVVATVLIAAVFGFVGVTFQWYGKPGYWGPYGMMMGFGLVSFISFLISHKNTDLAGASQTELRISAEEVVFTADPRMPEHQSTFLAMSQAFAAMAHMKELPPGDGFINSQGEIIPDSMGLANKAVNAANENARQLMADSLSALKITTPEGGEVHSIEVSQAEGMKPSDIQMKVNNIGPPV